jgi:hypothetical protein
MSSKKWVALAVVLAGLVLLIVLVVQASSPGQGPGPQGDVRAQGSLGTGFTYQGQLESGGDPVSESCSMAFRLYDQESGGNQVGSPITATVPVSDGLFTVDLDFGGSAFAGDARWLGIRVLCPGDAVYADLGRQALTAAPYALYSLSTGALQGRPVTTTAPSTGQVLKWDGNTWTPDSAYENVVIVAKSGGDYTSVQGALDSITDAATDNPYLVWVAPGVYSETVTMKPYVHLQGAGQEATVITSSVSSGSWPPTQATLLLASDTSLRDVTVGNSGTISYSTALLATAGMTRTLVADVTARAQEGGPRNYAIVLGGSGTGATLQQVIALAENGSERNYGLLNHDGAAAVLRGGSFTGRGGFYAIGVVSFDSNTTLEATGVSALGENGSADNYGLLNGNGAAMTLHGGSFTGRGGVNPFGIANNDSGTTLVAEGVIALAENGSGENYGLGNWISATATLRGGSFTGRGGTIAYGITNGASSTTLEAESVSALGENGSDGNHGLYNFSGAEATLSGGSFTGRGGTDAYGISNIDGGTTLVAESVTALGVDGITETFGLDNTGDASTTLNGGSFTARGGSLTHGIRNDGNGTTMEATGVWALGEDGSSTNQGLLNEAGATATLHGGSFTARWGADAYGIYNADGNTTLEATNVTARGADGSNVNYGLLNDNGAAAALRSSSFTGRGGTDSRGIRHDGSVTVLQADGVTALGEDASSENYGLYSTNSFSMTLRGGSFTGRGGNDVRGIYNYTNTLEATGITALGEDGNNNSYGLYNENGVAVLHGGSFTGRGGSLAYGIASAGTTLEATSVTALGDNNGLLQSGGTVSLGVTQLDGGANWGGSGRTCFQVYNGSFAPITCP